MRVSTAVRNWFAGLALLAILAGGVGVAAAMTLGSVKAPEQATTPRTTLAPPPPKAPTRWSSPST